MFKKIALLLICFFTLLIPFQAFALEEGSIIYETDFSSWEYGAPEGFDFYSPYGLLEEEKEGSAALSLDESGYAFLTRQIDLEPECAYKITVPVEVEDVSGEGLGANINIEYHTAVSNIATGSGEELLTLYVATNTDEMQSYILRVGLGSEDWFTNGSVLIKGITIEKLEEQPEGETFYTLVGSIGLTGTSYEESDEENAPVINYNNIGVALFFALLTVALYLFCTSRHAPRFFKRVSSRTVLIFCFILAFILRLYIASKSTGHISDLNCFKAWSYDISLYGLSGFYESGIFADYPPLYMYVLYFLSFPIQLLSLEYDSIIYQLIIQLPAILADLGIAFFAYRFAQKRRNQETAAMIAVFLLALPMIITDSCVWGQVDSIFTLAIIGMLYLLYKDKLIASCALFMVSLLIKPQALIFAPVFAIVLLHDLITKGKTLKTLKNLGLGIIAMAAIYTVVSLPMKGGQSFFYVFERMLDTTTQYAYGSVNAFNFFGLIGANFMPDSTAFLGISYRLIGIIFILIFFVLALFFYFKKKDRKQVFLLAGFFVLGIYLFAHNMHERYVYPAVICILFAAIESDSKRLFSSAMILSALAFINMYVVLIFETSLIYQWIVTLGAILYLLAFAYFIYSVYCVMFSKKTLSNDSFTIDCSHIPSYEAAALAAAKQRLSTAPHLNRRIHKKDTLILLIITAVYGAVALLALGSTVIPEEAPCMQSEEETSYLIELKEADYVEEIKFYTGYCGGNFSLSASEDGVNFFEPYTTEREHEYHDMFRWQKIEFSSYAKYIKLTLTSGNLELREIAFFDENNKQIAVKSASVTANGTTSPGDYLIDEQTQAPETTSYMTEMYFDEIYHARTAYEYINGIYPYEITHPPLGKGIISIGIKLFGMNPFGWRFMGALCGICMLPVFYIFAKRIFKKTRYAAISTILFASEFMHFSLTRIATIDSYTLFFILLMYLCMFEYKEHNFFTEKLSRTFLPLGLCGLFFALGAATKWICLYAGVGLCILFFYTIYQRTKEYHYLKDNNDPLAGVFRKKLTLTLLFCVGVFLVLPAAVYVLSYLPYQNTAESFGLAGVLKNQSYMLNYHGNLTTDSPHPYSSSVYSWPFDIRPVFFFNSSGDPSGYTAVIWCFLNPIIAWSGILALLFLLGKRENPLAAKTIDLKGAGFLSVAALCQFLPNVLITREMFIYHYFTVIPFLIFGIVYVLRYFYEHYRYGKIITIAFTVICVGAFAAFYPVLSGVPITYPYGRILQWFSTWPI